MTSATSRRFFNVGLFGDKVEARSRTLYTALWTLSAHEPVHQLNIKRHRLGKCRSSFLFRQRKVVATRVSFEPHSAPASLRCQLGPLR